MRDERRVMTYKRLAGSGRQLSFSECCSLGCLIIRVWTDNEGHLQSVLPVNA